MLKIAKILNFVILFTLLLGVSVQAASREVQTSGGNRNVSYIEVDLNQNYNIYAFSAQTLLGRQTATLPEFAAALADMAGDDLIIFPVNYLRSTGDNSVVGALLSQGALDDGGEDWFHWAATFDWQNQFSLNEGGLSTWSIPSDLQSAFEAYPFLVQNGARFNVQPTPAMDSAFLNARAFRAFMGQRADGIFVVGNVPNTNIAQLQDIAQAFGLTNAVNIDGGASVGLWRNGTLLNTPGRQLASVAVITNNRTSVPSAVSVQFNGQPLSVSPVVANDVWFVPISITQLWDMRAASARNANTGEIFVVNPSQQSFMTFREGVATFQIGVGGAAQPLPAAPFMRGGELFVPLTSLANQFGFDVGFGEDVISITNR
ncbi:MAG: phosphodiester glycosidase family protein [Turicibacter sp.]|nr:phosphodiester glycosidase family protein [Turicibacter sp.]